MAASTRVGRRRGQARGGEAGLINNLLLPQASEKGRAASAEEQEREPGRRSWPPRLWLPWPPRSSLRLRFLFHRNLIWEKPIGSSCLPCRVARPRQAAPQGKSPQPGCPSRGWVGDRIFLSRLNAASGLCLCTNSCSQRLRSDD